ncbi:MAG: glycosyltransferase [Cytophagales bacterium]|nr:MAG: glycosyltransferase [Cytophagales bacterium]
MSIYLVKVFTSSHREKIVRQFKKRSYEPIADDRVAIFPWFEFIREVADQILPHSITEYFLYWRDRIHDNWAASKLNKEYTIVVGYEECSVQTFRKAKQIGLITVLDLAQIHYKEIELISTEFPIFSEVYKNKKLRQKINQIKEEELALADYILCLSEFAKASLIKHGISADKITVVNLGFDPKKFTPKSIYQSNSNQALKIVYAGTVTKRKGIDQVLRLVEDMPNQIELSVIGAVSDASDIFQPYLSKIKWYPYLEQQEMNDIFNEQDVFVFPSYLDSWAMVVLEAMACGLPVVISTNTGAKDVVDHTCGAIISTGDYESLKKEITEMYLNRNEIENKGKMANQLVQKYTWAAYHLQIFDFFNKMNK